MTNGYSGLHPSSHGSGVWIAWGPLFGLEGNRWDTPEMLSEQSFDRLSIY